MRMSNNASYDAGTMIPDNPTIDAFLNTIVSRLYPRAQADGPPSANQSITIVHDPAQVDDILKSPDQFPKNFSLLSFLGTSRFNANEPEWQFRRNLTQPNYVRAAHSRSRSGIHAVYEATLSRDKGSTFSSDAVQRALLESAVTVFFHAFDCAVDAAALMTFFDRARPILKLAQYLSWVGTDDFGQSRLVKQANFALRAFAAEVERSPDLMNLMNRFRQEASSVTGFSPYEELLMNFFAGIETTAGTLGWAINCLGADPRIQDRIYQEVMRDDEVTPYLDCYLNETMRYFPAIPFVIRETVSPVTLGGVELKANSLVLVSVVGVHHHRDYWKEPHVFDTARTEFLDNTYDRRAFIPFLTGPRMCGGAKLARLELTEGMKAFVRLYYVTSGASDFSFDYGLAMRPNAWKHIEIRRRG